MEQNEIRKVRCLNCGTVHESKFCPHCGQAADTHRFNVRDAVHSIFITIIAGDNTFLKTAAGLMYRPGHLVREYLCGRRMTYFRPVAMLVRLVAIFALLSWCLHVNFEPLEVIGTSDAQTHINAKRLLNVILFLSSNKAVFALITSLIGILPFYLVFKRTKLEFQTNEPAEESDEDSAARAKTEEHTLNIAEHFYIQVYVTCAEFMLGIILLPLNYIARQQGIVTFISLAALYVFPTLTYTQLYPHHKVRHLMLSLLATCIAQLFLLLLIFLVFGLFYGFEYMGA